MYKASSSPSALAKDMDKLSIKKKGEEASGKKPNLLGVNAKKAEDFSKWYTEILQRSEMIDYHDISGCYILRPWAYSIWQSIQEYFDSRIRASGVENCYFPMLVTKSALEKEKDHIEGFAPEVAWVTRAGSTDLAEPVAIRPTSETIMYPFFAKWIQSHRDLPLRLNQWCNVLRWEFKHPQPFLRSREFLWQEGHSAFFTQEEADKEVLEILGFYEQVYENLLAIPVVRGRKSEKEKFGGADYTTTVEAYIPTSGRGIQGATSHCLGQNFAKMFDIKADYNLEQQYVYQNSWGLTTRTIGVMVMVHGDDKGLVLPPRVASIQFVIVPCGIKASSTDADREKIRVYCEKVLAELRSAGLRVKYDDRDNLTSGFKFNHWELRGVPMRIEVGPKDIDKSQVMTIRRDNGTKDAVPFEGLGTWCQKMIDTIHVDMFNRAKDVRDKSLVIIDSWDDNETGIPFHKLLDDRKLIMAPWCLTPACEDAIKTRSSRAAPADPDAPVDECAPSMGAKSLCIPFEQPRPVSEGCMCFAGCGAKAIKYTMFGRSY